MIATRLLSLCAALTAGAVAGCAPSVEQRGNLPPADAIAEIHPGKTTKDQVVKILGTPSSVGIFDDKSWYYISKRTKQVAFFLPDTTDQQVFIVDFDKNGVVSAVDHKGLKDAQLITPAPGATPAPGRELTFLEQILGNLGRFNGKGGAASGGSESKPQGPAPHD